MAKVNVDYWLSEDGLLLLECWARDFPIKDIYEKMGISNKTFWEWRKKYPELNEALRRGAEIVDYQVENALLKCALGYKTREVKTIISGKPDAKGNRSIKKEITEKDVAPNVTAIMAWLNNRKPDSWKRNRDNILETDDKNNNITVNIIRRGKREDEEDWEVNTNEEPLNGNESKSNNNESINKRNTKREVLNEEVDDGSWPEDWDE